MISTTAAANGVRAPLDATQATAAQHLVDVTMFWSATGGGVGRYLRSKQAFMTRHAPRWRHTLLVPGPAAPGQQSVAAPPLPFSHGYRFPVNRAAAARALARLAPDVIEAGDPYRLAWSALDAAERLGVPAVAFCHSHLGTLARQYGGARLGRAAENYLRHLYRRFRAVFAASHWMAGELRELGLDNVVHQPFGVDCTVFDPRRARPEWRHRLGLRPDDFVAVYAGRFAREKNLPVLAEAIGRLGNRAYLVLIGDGPAAPRHPRVIRLPYQPDPRSLATALASADLFVHAGDQETFGLAVLEALACGTPVVACARAGLLEFVDQHTVLGVERLTAVAFAEAIASVRVSVAERRDCARVRALQYDHRIAFARQFERYEQLRGAAPSAAAPALHGTGRAA